ncbi:hypothetical protein BLA29_012934, partial [Euroglyphus maynei]
MYRYGYYTNIWPLNTDWFDKFARKLHVERQNTQDLNILIEQLWPFRALHNLSLRLKPRQLTIGGGTVDEIFIQPSSSLKTASGQQYFHNKSS